MVYACVTVATAIVDITVYGPATRALECCDYEVLIWSGQLIMSLLGLVEQFEPLFVSELKPHE